MDPTAIEQQVRQQMEERSQVRERPCGTSQRMSQCIDLPCSTPALSHGCTCTDTGSCRTPVWYSHMCCAHQGGGAEEYSDLAPHRRVTVIEPVSTRADACSAAVTGARRQERGAEADALGAARQEAHEADRRGRAGHPCRRVQSGLHTSSLDHFSVHLPLRTLSTHMLGASRSEAPRDVHAGCVWPFFRCMGCRAGGEPRKAAAAVQGGRQRGGEPPHGRGHHHRRLLHRRRGGRWVVVAARASCKRQCWR